MQAIVVLQPGSLQRVPRGRPAVGDCASRSAARLQITVFLLGCVVVAGAFGAITVSQRIFWIQALPALVGLGRLG